MSKDEAPPAPIQMFNPADPAFAPVADVPGLPRVLLLGDSISIGYTPGVREILKGRANVHRPVDNCRQAAYGLEHLDAWLGSGRWDVIHFNFGLHDMKYLDPQGRYVTPDKGTQVAPPGEYAAALRRLVARLKKTGARLVFATTTPVPAGAEGRVKGDEVRYNQAAVAVMREEKVSVDDLGALAARDQARIQLPHNVHFTPEGYRELAAAAAGAIEAELKRAPQ